MIRADILSIGDRVRNGVYQPVSHFRRAINYRRSRSCLAMVVESVGAGPDRIVVSRSAWRTWPEPAPPLAISTTTLQVGDRKYSRRGIPIYRSALPSLKRSRDRRIGRALYQLETMLKEEAPARSFAHLSDSRFLPRARFARELFAHAAQQMSCLTRALRARKDPHALRSAARAARQLAGLGFGLTPNGDDYLAGILLALRVFGRGAQYRRWVRTLRRAARTGHDLSAHFLDLAADGCAPEALRELVRAIVCGDVARTLLWGRRVMRWGATSGADLLSGFVMAARSLNETRAQRSSL